MKLLSNLLASLALLVALGAQAEPAAPAGGYAYFAFEPDIITNYINKGRKLGYVRVTVEVMVDNESNLTHIEHHSPLIRDAIIEILGKQDYDDIRSLDGREEIRRRCLEVVNDLLVQETGRKMVNNLLFTKYLYQ
ncbi:MULTISPECIES: flagellar basal body-associated protein FliL [Aliagarivorans]|uniref:flagellar basal body-associated protein FliL n=1 Tax=Aliagarivorans TaxID=882379 RepID=UPI0004060D0B|nr:MULTISPECIES: flagellar basal body-associated protein FliL [Aliagarivorans]